MRNKTKRVLSVALALVMGLSSVSTSAFAAESELSTEPATEFVIEEVTGEDEAQGTSDVSEETLPEEEGAEPAEETPAEGIPEEDAEPAEADEGVPKDGDDEEVQLVQAEEPEASKSFNADIVISEKEASSEELRKVNIKAYADDDEDTCGYIFFWQYDGTFPDDADAWSSYFVDPYEDINVEGYDEEFGDVYIPVTLSDGSTDYVDAGMGNEGGLSYFAFSMPAGSSMDTDIEVSAEDADVYVMLEAAYVDVTNNSVVTTDYLPLAWEGEDVQSDDDEDGLSAFTFIVGEGGLIQYEIDNEIVTLTVDSMEEDGYMVEFPAGEEIEITANSIEGYLLDALTVYDSEGSIIGYHEGRDEETGAEIAVEAEEGESLTIAAEFKYLDLQYEPESDEEFETETEVDGRKVIFRASGEGYGMMNLYTDDSGYSLIESDDPYETVLDLDEYDQDVFYIYSNTIGDGEYIGYNADDGIDVTVTNIDTGLGGSVKMTVDLSEAEGGEVLTTYFDACTNYGIRTYADGSYDFEAGKLTTKAAYTPSVYDYYVGVGGNGTTMYNKHPIYGSSAGGAWGNGGWFMSRPTLNWTYKNLSVTKLSEAPDGAKFTSTGTKSYNGETCIFMRCNGTVNNSDFNDLSSNQCYVQCCDIEELSGDKVQYTFVCWHPCDSSTLQTTEGYYQIKADSTGNAKVRFMKYIFNSSAVATFSTSGVEAGNSTVSKAVSNASSGYDILGNKSSLMSSFENRDDDIDELDVDLRAGTKFTVYRVNETGINWITSNYGNVYSGVNENNASSYESLTNAVYAMMQDAWSSGSALSSDSKGRFTKYDTASVGSGDAGKTDWIYFDVSDQEKSGYADIYIVQETSASDALNLGWTGSTGVPSGYGYAGAIFFGAKQSSSDDDYSVYYRAVRNTSGLGSITLGNGTYYSRIDIYDQLKLYSAPITKYATDEAGNACSPYMCGLTWEDFSWQISTSSDFPSDNTISVPFSTGDPTSSTNVTTICGLWPDMAYYVREDPNCYAVTSKCADWCETVISFIISEDGSITYSEKYLDDVMSDKGAVDATVHSTVGVSNSGAYEFTNILHPYYYFDLLMRKAITDDYQTNIDLSGGIFRFDFYEYKTSASGTPDRTWYFETNEKGEIYLDEAYLSDRYESSDLYLDGDNNPCVKLGTMVVTEVRAPEGFLVSDETLTWVLEGNSVTVNHFEVEVENIDGHRTIVSSDVADNPINDIPRFGGLDLYKIDSAMDDGSIQGISSLAGATFEIVNENYYNVCLQTDTDTYYEPGEVVMTITTDENGYATTGCPMLQYGIYSIREVESSYGYWLDDSFSGLVYIHDDDTIVHLGDDSGYGDDGTGDWEDRDGYFVNEDGKNFDDSTVDYQIDKVNQIERRSDLAFEKVDIDGNHFAYIPFMISAYDENGNLLEQHVIVSDENGWVSTASRSYDSDEHGYEDCRPHSNHKNEFDQYVEGDKVTAEGQKLLDQSADGTLTGLENVASWGVWFQGNSNDYEGTPNDDYGALYTAYYQITEIQCDANADREENLLWSDVLFIENNTGDYNDVIVDNAAMHQYDPFVNTEIYLESVAQDAESLTKTIAESDTTEVQDTVSYDHLSSDKTYRMETKFVDITAGNETVPISGTNDPNAEVKTDDYGDAWVTKVFTPAQAHGTTTTDGKITLTALLDTTGRCGHTIVAVDNLYEYVEYADGTGVWLRVAKHENYADEDQMLYVPDLHTSAVDSITGDRIGDKTSDDSIIDTVDYTNLSRGMDYYITMEIVNAETGETINGTIVSVDIHKTGVTGLYDGEVVMPEYALDSSDFDGDMAVVVVEKLYLWNEDEEDTLLVEHDSLLDEDQTIRYPDVHTTAADGKTADDVGTVEDIATVYDEVLLTNIIFDDNDHEDGSPYSYTVKGQLVYQTDCVDADGASHKAGDPVPTLEGTQDEVTVTAYADGTATFTYPDGTEAKGSVSNMHCGLNVHKNIDENEDADNSYVEDSTALIADVTVELIYKLDSSILEGSTVVVFEDLYHNDVNVATHADLTDESQSVHYPDIHTSAVDTATGTNVGDVRQGDSIVDTVVLENLVPGRTYTVTGTLMDQSTGEELVINGETFTVSAEVVVTEDGEITAPNGERVTTTNYDETLHQVDGTIDLTFELDASGLEAVTAVAFETLIHNGVVVDTHEDITDNDQSVYYPKIRSSAWDSETLDHVGTIEGDDVVYDTVFLTNLKIGEEYTVYGVLYNKETQEPVLDVDGSLMTQSCTFIAGDTVAEVTSEHGSTDGHVEDVEIENLEITITERDDVLGYVNCEFVLAIPVDSRDFEGMTLAIVETLSYNGVDIANDWDYAMEETDEQTLFYPVLSSEALDTTTDDKLGAVPGEDGSTTIRDEITAANLIPGLDYTLNGVLVDLVASDIENGSIYYLRSDGTLTADKDEAYAKSITFTAESEKEDLILEFTLATDKIQGMALLVMTDLYHNDALVDEHPEEYTDGWHEEDLAEEAVYYPALKTNATDTVTDEHISNADGTRIIEDRVFFENLFLDREYTIEGQLVYQSDFVDADGVEHYAGEAVSETRSATFTAASDLAEAVQDDGEIVPVDSVETYAYETGQEVISGYVTLTFEVDESALAGATLVAFEDLYSEGVDLCPHHNLRDLPETIRIPKIGTSAASEGDIDENSIYDENGNFKDIVITDRVTYQNLWTQEELDLMHEQGLDLIYLDGTYRVGERTIFDINESATYMLKGVLMDKETGEPLVNADGDTYEVYSEPFSPATNNGYYDIDFVLNGADFVVDGECILEGKTVVVFEYLYVTDNPDGCTDDRETAFHEDIEDAEQDIRFPKGRTHATDTADAVDIAGSDYIDAVVQAHEGESSTTAHEIMADGTVSITDLFAFENLHGATVYTVTAALQKVTGYDANGIPNAWEPALDDDGNAITQTVELDTSIYSDNYEDSVSGYLPIVFNVSAENLAGYTTVMFESVYRDGTAVLVHADITDEAQTIAFPAIGTKAEDGISGTSEILAADKSYVLDTVSYENLEAGKEYTLTAALYDLESGLRIEDAETTGSFIAGNADQVITPNGTYIMTRTDVTEFLGGYSTGTAWDADAKADTYANASMGSAVNASLAEYGGQIQNRISGEVSILVELDSTWLDGHTLVAFEYLYAPEGDGSTKEVAEHTDIEDEGQTVYIPKIGTTATVGNAKEVNADGTITIDDVVAYENLQPGKEYKVRGVIMDKTTGESLNVYASETFTPEESDGEVHVKFNVDVSNLAGHTLVVFEELLTEDDDNGYHIVAEHKDLTDEGQSITVRQPGTPIVKTGDDFNWMPIIIALLVIVILILAGLLLRQRKNPGNGAPAQEQTASVDMPEADKPSEPSDAEISDVKPEADAPKAEDAKPEAEASDDAKEDPKTE